MSRRGLLSASCCSLGKRLFHCIEYSPTPPVPGENALTDIPLEITGLVNLSTLSLAKNQLSGTIYTEIGNLKALQRLLLHSNPIGGVLPTELGSLDHLGLLDVSDTDLSGEIPRQIGTIPSLTKVDVHGTAIVGNLDLLFCATQYPDVSANCLDPAVVCSCCSECCDASGEKCEQY